MEQTLRIILDSVTPICGFEKLSTLKAINRVLVQGIRSEIDVPGHTNSAVDGFAIRYGDLSGSDEITELGIIGSAYAGSPYRGNLNMPAAIRIMTGSVVPEGADTVVMQEHTEILADRVRVKRPAKSGENIRSRGEDIKKGGIVLDKGHVCSASDIGLIASLGISEITVLRQPRIALLSTGDEIKSIGTDLRPGEIYDSNRYSLNAALGRLNIETIDLGIIGDDKDRLTQTIKEAAGYTDMIITSGGVSVGEADYTKEIIDEFGEVLVRKVAIKPGRPLMFGNIMGCQFFGLPGNPVAVMVTFYHFVLPALKKMMGVIPEYKPWTLIARSTQRIRKKTGRTEIQRGILCQEDDGSWSVRTTGRQGSGILSSMSQANAFIILSHDGGSVEVGDEVVVQPFQGLF